MQGYPLLGCGTQGIQVKYFVTKVYYNNCGRLPYSWMWHCMISYKLTGSSEGPNGIIIIIISVISFILVMLAARPSETSLNFYQTIRYRIPKDGNPHCHLQGNIKPQALLRLVGYDVMQFRICLPKFRNNLLAASSFNTPKF